MPRNIRYVTPGTVLEITTRCAGELNLMTPTPEVRDAILGVLALALKLFPSIELHSFIFLSNHYHLLLTVHDPETLSRFMCYLNGNIARRVSWIIGHTGRFWSRRFADIPVIDAAAELERFRYLGENGCKEGLVASPFDWPGPTSARALAFGEPLLGKWVNVTELSKARRRDPSVSEEAFTYWLSIKLTPLPALQSLPEPERTALYLRIFREIEAKHAGKRVKGAARVIQQDPFSRPGDSDRSPEPKCHASDLVDWIIEVEWFLGFQQLYREISARIRSRELPLSDLPFGTHPPPMHFNPTRNIRSKQVLAASAACAAGP